MTLGNRVPLRLTPQRVRNLGSACLLALVSSACDEHK